MFQNQPPYGQQASTSYYDPQAAAAPNLQFYSAGGADQQFYASRPSLEGNMAAGSMAPGGAPNFGGNIQGPQGWLAAFSSAGFEGEPPLMEG